MSDVILCGHYGCGGVKAAMENTEHGLVDNWLRGIKDIYHKEVKALQSLDNENAQLDLLCELNVKQQVRNLSMTPIVQKAWLRGQTLSVHGIIFGINNGIIKDLKVTTNAIDQVEPIYQLKA